jgi:hypothetical protein
MVSFTPRPLYPQGKSPWHPLDRGLGGPHSRSGRGVEEKNSQPPPGFEPQYILCRFVEHSLLVHLSLYNLLPLESFDK